MADEGKPTEPMEGTEESRRTKLLKRSRDATGEGGYWTFVGGIPYSVVAKLKARDEDEPEKPGDDSGPADGPFEPPGS